MSESAPILPESQKDIQILCDTDGLIAMAMITVAAAWDERDGRCDCSHPLTMVRHRALSLEIVASLKQAALEKQRQKDRLRRMTDAATPVIVGLDGEPTDGT